MAAVVLACGETGLSLGDDASSAFTQRDDIRVHRVAARPGKDDVEEILSELDGRRLVVAGTDADLAAVVLRLLRTERVPAVDLGFVPAESSSAVARRWGLPRKRTAAVETALTGPVRPVPLVRDDNGGVLVGVGSITALDAVAYCDDTRVLSGAARQLRVLPDRAGLRVEVVTGRFGQVAASATGRACQIGGELPEIVSDGVPHGRPMPRWTWYRHTEDLRLVRPE
ncbi:MAG TPA: hypothetical protein VHX38_15630 [Pseudonocardiaceae bacterium]|nr:hypothetical protein [Pseudonocardiaceae bacterium]